MNKRDMPMVVVALAGLAIVVWLLFGGSTAHAPDVKNLKDLPKTYTGEVKTTNANYTKEVPISSNTNSMSELKIEDLKVGTGKVVKSGDTVVIHYKGTLLDGTKFDSSYDRGQPFETQIGVGQVIKGWDEGVIGMKIGGKRKLIIPPQLGYGERGAGAAIPPNSVLVFELELVNIK